MDFYHPKPGISECLVTLRRLDQVQVLHVPGSYTHMQDRFVWKGPCRKRRLPGGFTILNAIMPREFSKKNQ